MNFVAEKLSVVIPAKNESRNLRPLISKIKEVLDRESEIIVVDDGSNDQSGSIAEEIGAKLISRAYSSGNGAAIKSGARRARGDVIIFMDGDGQHDPNDIPRLLHVVATGSDMAVGARRSGSQGSIGRRFANAFYNRLASYMTGHRVQDLTSGFRAVRANKFREFLYLLPNGFSYPTTITMAFFRAGYSVEYVPITAAKREGKSHIRPLHDGLRFLVIIFKVATLYSPLKIFVPASAGMFGLGLAYYGYTYLTQGRFTNMSALLLTTAVLAFLIGLVSEQITQLMYKD
ncbi:glycosyltransferase family 2 protein [Arhodomonas sp. SL1]|uniref:glycosyltransferase family 2 protein n=1 Tax=Arhodomonas sp. SL1 TaxID=3425691 RepID=UPI003F88527C